MGYTESRMREALKNHVPRDDGKSCAGCDRFRVIIHIEALGHDSGRCVLDFMNVDDFDYCENHVWRKENP